MDARLLFESDPETPIGVFWQALKADEYKFVKREDVWKALEVRANGKRGRWLRPGYLSRNEYGSLIGDVVGDMRAIFVNAKCGDEEQIDLMSFSYDDPITLIRGIEFTKNRFGTSVQKQLRLAQVGPDGQLLLVNIPSPSLVTRRINLGADLKEVMNSAIAAVYTLDEKSVKHALLIGSIALISLDAEEGGQPSEVHKGDEYFLTNYTATQSIIKVECERVLRIERPQRTHYLVRDPTVIYKDHYKRSLAGWYRVHSVAGYYPRFALKTDITKLDSNRPLWPFERPSAEER